MFTFAVFGIDYCVSYLITIFLVALLPTCTIQISCTYTLHLYSAKIYKISTSCFKDMLPTAIT